MFRHGFTTFTWSKDPSLSASEVFEVKLVTFDNIEIALIKKF